MFNHTIRLCNKISDLYGGRQSFSSLHGREPLVLFIQVTKTKLKAFCKDQLFKSDDLDHFVSKTTRFFLEVDF